MAKRRMHPPRWKHGVLPRYSVGDAMLDDMPAKSQLDAATRTRLRVLRKWIASFCSALLTAFPHIRDGAVRLLMFLFSQTATQLGLCLFNPKRTERSQDFVAIPKCARGPY